MKCPNCGGTVDFEDVVDYAYHNHAYYDLGYGTCPKCNKTWGWTKVFVYARDEDIQEMKDNDHL